MFFSGYTNLSETVDRKYLRLLLYFSLSVLLTMKSRREEKKALIAQ